MSWTHYRNQKKIGRILQICYKDNLVTALLHIEILETNSKLSTSSGSFFHQVLISIISSGTPAVVQKPHLMVVMNRCR
jgi:hypothetical protein